MQITEVAQNTYLIDVAKIATRHAHETAYLLTGDKLALIEPGSTVTISKILSGLNEHGFNLENLAYIIPTHIHVDHGGGTGYLANNFPGAKVVLHPKAVKHMIDPTKLIHGTKLVFGDNLEKQFGPILPVPEDQIHATTEGEVIRLGKRELRIVFSPGHSPHHISIQDSLTGGLFCGEALGIPLADAPNIPIPAAAPPSFDLDLYLASMDKLKKLSPEILFYSHDGVGHDVDNLIELAKENSRSFGDIILDALEAGVEKEEIYKRLFEYLKRRFPEAEPVGISEVSVAGYIGYFENKKQHSSG